MTRAPIVTPVMIRSRVEMRTGAYLLVLTASGLTARKLSE